MCNPVPWPHLQRISFMHLDTETTTLLAAAAVRRHLFAADQRELSGGQWVTAPQHDPGLQDTTWCEQQFAEWCIWLRFIDRGLQKLVAYLEMNKEPNNEAKQWKTDLKSQVVIMDAAEVGGKVPGLPGSTRGLWWRCIAGGFVSWVVRTRWDHLLSSLYLVICVFTCVHVDIFHTYMCIYIFACDKLVSHFKWERNLSSVAFIRH